MSTRNLQRRHTLQHHQNLFIDVHFPEINCAQNIHKRQKSGNFLLQEFSNQPLTPYQRFSKEKKVVALHRPSFGKQSGVAVKAAGSFKENSQQKSIRTMIASYRRNTEKQVKVVRSLSKGFDTLQNSPL